MSGRVAAAVGMFDGVHLGHQALVRQVASVGDEAVIFTFAKHPMEVVCQERAPLMLSTSDQRRRWLLEAGAQRVEVLDFDEHLRQLSARDFMRMLRDGYGMGALVVGFNHRFGHDRLSDFADYARIGAEEGIDVSRGNAVVLDGFDQPVSSSLIRSALRDGDIESANTMLGRPFCIAGCVGHGRRVGHTIGFPTANVVPSQSRQLIPAVGAYAGEALVANGERYPMMVNVGYRPTINEDAEHKHLTIEAHLIGYDGDLYGKQLEISFLSRLRGEQRFDSLYDLKEQLCADREAALALLAKRP